MMRNGIRAASPDSTENCGTCHTRDALIDIALAGAAWTSTDFIPD